MALELDWRDVRRGMAAYLALAAPCGVVIALLHGSDTTGHESDLWTVAAVILIVAAPIIGGVVAGSAQPAPLIHGAVAVAVPAGSFLALRSVVGVAQGSLTTEQAVTFLLYLVVFTGLGMLGGYFGFRRRQRLT